MQTWTKKKLNIAKLKHMSFKYNVVGSNSNFSQHSELLV